jgi:hypothetical protein
MKKKRKHPSLAHRPGKKGGRPRSQGVEAHAHLLLTTLANKGAAARRARVATFF